MGRGDSRRTFPAALFGALLGAIVGATAAWLLRGATDARPETGDDADSAAGRLAALERENRDLRRRLDLSRAARRAEPPPVPPSSPSAGDGDRAPAPGAPRGDPVRLLPGAVRTLTLRPDAAPAADLPADANGLVGALRDAVARGDEARAEAVQRALAALGPATVDELHRLVADSSTPEGVLHRALEVLASTSAPGLAATAEAIVRRTEASAATRSLAMRAAVTADPGAAVGAVQRLLWSGTPGDVELAREALGNSADRAFLPLLREQSQRTESPRHVPAMLGAIAAIKDRRWSAMQLTGEPDTTLGGDLGTAWAAKSEQMGRVWIETDYETAVFPDLVRIRESFNGGAVVRIEAKLADGTYASLWEGTAAAAETPRWFEPPLASSREAVRTVRVTLDTDAVRGWNEIDAVELIGGGLRQWASSARASTSYAD